MSKDFKDILKCLSIDKEGISHKQEDTEYLQYLCSFFPKMQPTQKRPDAFAEMEETAFLLEHFQFDNSNNNSKGSIQRQICADSERNLNNILNNGKIFVSIPETVTKSGQFYVKSFQKQFCTHANKIGIYKKEIQEKARKKYNKFLMGFVIEDASLYGSIYLDNGDFRCVDLLETKEFLDLFEKTKDLDFVIFAMTGSSENKLLSFISRNTIEQHRKNQIEASKIQRFCFENSFCVGTDIYISLFKINTKTTKY